MCKSAIQLQICTKLSMNLLYEKKAIREQVTRMAD
jgi:hypothetical protein